MAIKRDLGDIELEMSRAQAAGDRPKLRKLAREFDKRFKELRKLFTAGVHQRGSNSPSGWIAARAVRIVRKAGRAVAVQIKTGQPARRNPRPKARYRVVRRGDSWIIVNSRSQQVGGRHTTKRIAEERRRRDWG